MHRKIVLMTPREEYDGLVEIMGKRLGSVTHGPDAVTIDTGHAETLEALDGVIPVLSENDRVISFANPLIIPAALLDRLKAPIYNFHIGPPAYPGLFPACFALYDGATEFGATAHVLTAAVDQGPIIGVEMAPVPAHMNRLELEALSRSLVTRLFERLVPDIVGVGGSEGPPESGMVWGSRVTRRQDFEALCRLPVDVSADEFHRRLRAVGEGPDHALCVTLHDRRFRLVSSTGNSDDNDTVIKGGRPVRTGPRR